MISRSVRLTRNSRVGEVLRALPFKVVEEVSTMSVRTALVLSVLLLLPASTALAAVPGGFCYAGPGCKRLTCRACGLNSYGFLGCVSAGVGNDGGCGCILQGTPAYACQPTGICIYGNPCIYCDISAFWEPPAARSRSARVASAKRLLPAPARTILGFPAT